MNIQKQIEESIEFNELWWSAVKEGEPIAQDEIDEVREIIAYVRNQQSIISQLAADIEKQTKKIAYKDKIIAEAVELMEDREKSIKVLENYLEELRDVTPYEIYKEQITNVLAEARAIISPLEGSKPNVNP